MNQAFNSDKCLCMYVAFTLFGYKVCPDALVSMATCVVTKLLDFNACTLLQKMLAAKFLICIHEHGPAGQ